jgi:hypothetical protein
MVSSSPELLETAGPRRDGRWREPPEVKFLKLKCLVMHILCPIGLSTLLLIKKVRQQSISIDDRPLFLPKQFSLHSIYQHVSSTIAYLQAWHGKTDTLSSHGRLVGCGSRIARELRSEREQSDLI